MMRRWTTPSFSVGRRSHVPGRFSWAAVWIASAAVRSTLCAPSRRSVKTRGSGRAGWLAASVVPGRSASGADAAATEVGVAPAMPRSNAAATSVPAARTRGAGTVRLRPSSSAASIRLSSCSRTRHADGNRRHAMIAEGVGNLEQMTRVFTGLRARRDHAVVARELPFDPQPPRDPPHGRMEPGTRHRPRMPASGSGNRDGRCARARAG